MLLLVCRSTVLLLSQLPLTERCVSLRQQGALQLLAKLLPGKKQQPPPVSAVCQSQACIWSCLCDCAAVAMYATGLVVMNARSARPGKDYVPLAAIGMRSNPSSRYSLT